MLNLDSVIGVFLSKEMGKFEIVCASNVFPVLYFYSGLFLCGLDELMFMGQTSYSPTEEKIDIWALP